MAAFSSTLSTVPGFEALLDQEARTAADREAFAALLTPLDPLALTQVLMEVVWSEQEDLIPVAIAPLPATEAKGLLEAACKYPGGALLGHLVTHLEDSLLNEVWMDFTGRGKMAWLQELAGAWQPTQAQAQVWLVQPDPAGTRDPLWAGWADLPVLHPWLTEVFKVPTHVALLPETHHRFQANLRAQHLAARPTSDGRPRRRA